MEYTARKILKAISDELNDRRGLGWNDYDDGAKQEIEEALLDVIGSALKGEAIEAGVQLAAVGAVIEGGGVPGEPLPMDHYGWSSVYQSALNLKAESATITEQVSEFARAFGYPVRDRSQLQENPSGEEVGFRVELIAEEFCEFLEACGYETGNVEAELDRMMKAPRGVFIIEGVADALGDIDYVVEGARLAFGIPRQRVANAIHKSNMAKVGGPVLPGGKQLKPAGWKPPDIVGALFDYELSFKKD